MAIDYKEWIKQSEYDLETAKYMFQGGRNFYAVFMCHLSIEKALKGLITHKKGILPPKSHNLIALLQQAQMHPPENLGTIIVKINEASVATRYPEEIDHLVKEYSVGMVSEVIEKTSGVLQWIKKQF